MAPWLAALHPPGSPLHLLASRQHRSEATGRAYRDTSPHLQTHLLLRRVLEQVLVEEEGEEGSGVAGVAGKLEAAYRQEQGEAGAGRKGEGEL